jgi:endogenous inhibitor of DNA gyrase (YacG/DUF329 family)
MLNIIILSAEVNNAYHFCSEGELSLERWEMGEKTIILKENMEVSTARQEYTEWLYSAH